MNEQQKETLKKKRLERLKLLQETIDTIAKARKIQKARVDSNIMREELSQEEIEKFHKPLTDLVEEKSKELMETLEENTTRIPIESSVREQKSIEAPLPSIKELPSTSKESSKSLKETLKVFYPDEGIDKEIVKVLHRFKMPSEILEDRSLFEENYNRVVKTLKSLGGQKKGKLADPLIGDYIKALSAYNERIKLIKEALDQNEQSQTGTGITYKYYTSCDELIEKLNLLCGSKDANNNSPEIRNEIVSILDILLNKGMIDANSHKLLYNKWCC